MALAGLIVSLLWLYQPSLAATDEAGNVDLPTGTVWLVEFDGPLGPAMADLIARSIDNAAAAGARALIIRMDTPGGLDKSMRMLIKRILASPIPIVTYVAPGGARAASAGTYIAYASHVAAMAPATNIGSSTPVSLAPQPQLPAAPKPKIPLPTDQEGGDGDSSEDNADAEAAEKSAGKSAEDTDEYADPTPSTGADAMARKVVNDAVAYLQGLAELRGRNIDWAEATVREGANLRASQALALGVVDLISPSLDSLLQDLDGREVKLESGTVTLRTADVTIHRVETDWKHDLLEIITDPTIAYGLLIFGIYGLILEFYSPGMIFPSVIGIVCLLLGAYGLQMLPVNYAGLALIVVGIGLMVAELITPTLGILGFAGIVAFVFGSVILIDTQTPGYTLPLSAIAAFSIATGGVIVMAIGAAMRARNQRVVTGAEGMVGGEATALEDFETTGRVFAFGEAWRAHSARPVSKGDLLEVRAVDGLTLEVAGQEPG
jgi:membrane-bound serine protease (ClpP class)